MYTVVIWSDILNSWALHGSRTFAAAIAADSYAARKRYEKYVIIPFGDFNKYNKPGYKFSQVIGG